jgi:hypothetical protein
METPYRWDFDDMAFLPNTTPNPIYIVYFEMNMAFFSISPPYRFSHTNEDMEKNPPYSR